MGSKGNETKNSFNSKQNVADNSLEQEDWTKISRQVAHLQYEFISGGYSEEKEVRQKQELEKAASKLLQK